MTNLLKPSLRFQDNIQPAFDEYASDPLNERRANILASAIDHQVDWTFEYLAASNPSRLPGDASLGDFRRNLFGQCPDLRAMSDLSDASHHRFLTRERTPARSVTTSTDAYVICENELVVKGYDRPFAELVQGSFNFWKSWTD